MSPRATVGLGSNLGDSSATIRAALDALAAEHELLSVSPFYRSEPWGVEDQPPFVNAVAVIATDLAPEDLLESLKAIESRLGRVPSYSWGHRALDLDILLYDDVRVDRPELQIPHPRMHERAFVLVPLAEVDERFAGALERLDPEERRKVKPLNQSESSGFMSDLIDRVRTLAAAFIETDLVRLRIEEPNEDAVEFRRKAVAAAPSTPAEETPAEPARGRIEGVKAELVGIVHLSRPAPAEGDVLTGDRELAHVEALGIRTPVRSLGPGRIAAVRIEEGQPVEYGQVLFEIDRG